MRDVDFAAFGSEPPMHSSECKNRPFDIHPLVWYAPGNTAPLSMVGLPQLNREAI